MRPWSRALRALPFTFVIYVLQAVLASFAALPSGLELARQLRTSQWDRAQWALLLDKLPELGALLRVSALSGLVALVVLLVISPWLQMSWLVALDQPVTPLGALARGAHLWLRACLVSLLIAALFALTCLPLLLIAYAAHTGLGPAPVARVHDLALACALGPLPLVALFFHAVHDLARARALYRGVFDGVRHGLRAALGLRILARALGFWALGSALVLLGQAIAAVADGPFRFPITVVVLQSALLGRLFVRSVWLGRALTCVLPELAPLAELVSEDVDE